MRDPYEVLEVGRNASQQEIKAAYKRLVKKYHPDKYQDNPLADLAQEKLKEVNEAYDALTNQGGNFSSNDNGSAYQQDSRRRNGQSGMSQFNDARQYIDRGNLQAAETILRNSALKNAEWYFLNGMIAHRKGWQDQAISNIQQAVSMEPDNYEYSNALNRLTQQGSMFRNTAYGRGYSSNEDMMCRMCQCYLCTDLLCDCI